MRCKELLNEIEAVYPKETALDFDNVGLLCGSYQKEVKKLYLALDASETVIDAAIEWGADLLITHHPLIFSPLKAITDADYTGRRLIKLIQSGMSYYAMHTNYDVMGMAELSANILGLDRQEVLDETVTIEGAPAGIGRIGFLPEPQTLLECCEYVKQKLKLEQVRVFGNLTQEVLRLAISPGSGKSAIAPAMEKGADVLVTGDITYSCGLDAMEQGLAVIDAGHYGTEYIFIEDIKSFLLSKGFELEIQTAEIINPFQTV